MKGLIFSRKIYWFLVLICAGWLFLQASAVNASIPGTPYASTTTTKPNVLPAGASYSCLLGSPCPIIRWDDYTFYIHDEQNNYLYMIVTAYDSNLNMLGHKFYSGARYIAEIEVDPDQETITLYGQADRTITISWDELVRLTRVTSTVLTATPNPAVKGEQVTLTAEVTGDLPVSGEVVFKLGSSTLGTKNLGPDGTATLTTTDLPVGTHTLTAEYLGDENSSGSVSNKVTLIVENKEFTVTFDSKGGSAVGGQTVEEGSLLEEPVSTRGDTLWRAGTAMKTTRINGISRTIP